MPNTITATQRLDHSRAEFQSALDAQADRLQRMDALRAAAALGGGKKDSPIVQEAAALAATISGAAASISVLESAVHAAEDDVAAGVDPHEVAEAEARETIRRDLERRAILEADDAIRRKAVALADDNVSKAEAALAEFAESVERPARDEAAAMLRAQAEGEPIPERKIDPTKVRRRKFDLTEAIEEAKAARAEIKAGRPDGDSVAACNARIGDAAKTVIRARAAGDAKRFAYLVREIIKLEVSIRGSQHVIGHLPNNIMADLEGMPRHAGDLATGARGRNSYEESAQYWTRTASALAADPSAPIDCRAALESGEIWFPLKRC
jgi:hypothetical protein